MSTINLGSHVSRTYGKRSGLKRKQTKESTEPKELVSTGTESDSIKRRRLSPDLEPEPRMPSPTETDIDIGTDNEEIYQQKPPVNVVYGSPRISTRSVQQSPSKPARDLSVIFDDIAPSKYPSASPSKLAKRMLSRSKTDSSVEGQSASQIHGFERTPSLPNLSSPSKNPEPMASTSKTAGAMVPLIPPSSNTPVTRTYAGKFRSFLVSLPPSSNDPMSTAIEEDEFDTKESYTALRNRWGVDISEDDPYISPSPSKSTKSHMSTPNASPSRNGRKSKVAPNSVRPPLSNGAVTLKSISELRHKGESRRFLDEVGYLFEGMDKKGGISLRRASALEITTKLCDPEFTRKAKAADFFSRTWDVFIEAGAGKGEDKILDTILVFFMALVARDVISLTELAQRMPSAQDLSTMAFKQTTSEESGGAPFIDILFSILGNTPSNADPLSLVVPNGTTTDFDFKKAGISKMDRLTLASVYKTIISKSNLFSPNTPITTSLLISYTLQALAPSSIPVNYLPPFLTSLRSTLAPGMSTSLKSALSFNWSNAAELVPYENIYYHLRLLDTYLLDQWESTSALEGSQSQTEENVDVRERNENEMEKARDTWLAEDLICLGVCIEINKSTNDSESSQGCLDTTLRILVSLTHTNELWGRKVVQCEYTMGWLMRLILKNGQDIQQNRTHFEAEHPVKLEEQEEQPLDDQEGTRPDTLALDTLCLALGLLTNLVQIVQEAKHTVHDARLSPSCTLKKWVCAQKCICPHPLSGIEILARLYSQQQVKTESPPDSLSEDSPEARAEAEASFLRGHLAILFGLLMMNNPENQAAIMAALPSPSSAASPNAKSTKIVKRAKMARLVEQAKDFAAFYTAVSNNLGGEKDSKVVKEVVTFLETQRESLF